MTIIAAMRESEKSILIGADSGETDTNTGLRLINEKKLQLHPCLPLAWGACGNPAVGIDGFAEWLKKEQGFNDWKTFREACEDEMAKLSSRQVRIRKTIGLPDNLLLSDGADILIVGFMENALRILVVERDGKGSFVSQNFHAIGIKPDYLAVCYKAIEKIRVPGYEDFKNILDSGARSFLKCDPPIHIWRVSTDGVFSADTSKLLTGA